jgi:hypothetical protein
MNRHWNNEGQEYKQVMLGEGISRRERVTEEGKGGWTWLRYFLYKYEYGTLKLVEVILRREVGEEGE